MDVASRFLFIRAIESRSQAVDFLRELRNRLKTITGRDTLVLTTDNVREYISTEASKLETEHGMQHVLTTPYSPEENGISERVNHTIVSVARKDLKHSNLDRAYRADACYDAAFKYNRMSHASTQTIPYTSLHGKTHRWPTNIHLRTSGVHTEMGTNLKTGGQSARSQIHVRT